MHGAQTNPQGREISAIIGMLRREDMDLNREKN